MHVNLSEVRQFSPSIKRPRRLQGQQAVALRIVYGVGRAIATAEARIAVDQVQVDAFPRTRELHRPIAEAADRAAFHRSRSAQLMGGVLHADADAERLRAAEVGKQRAVLAIRVVAE